MSTGLASRLTQQQKEILFYFALLLLPFLLYISFSNGELIWNSKPVVLENTLLKEGANPLEAFQRGYLQTTSQQDIMGPLDYYRPLTTLSFMMERALWGLQPITLRLMNILIFLLSLFPIYSILKRYLNEENRPIARYAIFLFSLFPTHLDSVLWVLGRSDLLVLLFGVCSVLYYDRYLEKSHWPHAALSLLFFSMALLSKESALFFLPIFLLLLIHKKALQKWPLFLPFLSSGLIYWWLRSLILPGAAFPFRLYDGLLLNLKALFGSLGYYTKTLLIPVNFSSFMSLRHATDVLLIGIGVLLVAALVWIAIFKRNHTILTAAWLWTAPFIMGSALLVFTPLKPFSLTSRNLLLPSLGFSLLLAFGITKIPQKIRIGLLILVLLFFSISIFDGAKRYQSELDFWLINSRHNDGHPHLMSETARALIRANRPLEAEPLLLRTMSQQMNVHTARLFTLTWAELTLAYGLYQDSLNWLEQYRKVTPFPIQQPLTENITYRIHLARGELMQCESLLEKSRLAQYTDTTAVRINHYTALAQWQKVRDIIEQLPLIERETVKEHIKDLEADFTTQNLDIQIRFFQSYGNYSAAWKLMSQREWSDPQDLLQLAKLALLSGQMDETNKICNILAISHPGKPEVLTSIGLFYESFGHFSQSLPYFKQASSLDSKYSELNKRIAYLESVLQERKARKVLSEQPSSSLQ